eukprot:c22984_g1_i1.p1 GENE.c22984_g1_i1~~c22984_g1_i1.p1  ORF type:complete len:591 (+),score=117.06 c22984_g1_i1:50-1774(+)
MGDTEVLLDRVTPSYGTTVSKDSDFGESSKTVLMTEKSSDTLLDPENPSPSGQQQKPKEGCEPLRLVILLCICALTFGSYWVFDTPGAIPTKLRDYFAEKHKSLSKSENLTFYSVYSWPNTVLALFGGIIIDRITGLRFGSMIFCSFVFLGQATFALGIITRSFPLAVVGRFMFGLGGESLTVAQNSFTVKWFEGGKYLALAFGTVVSFARIGSSVNFIVTPALAAIDVPFALIFGVGTCGLSLGVCCLLSLLDKWASKNRPEMITKEAKPAQENSLGFAEVLAQVKQITLAAWILNFICMFFYVGVLTFNTVASDIMQNTGSKYDETTATRFLSIPNFVSVVASPAFGLLVDKKGRALVWICIASAMMIISMLVFLGNATEIIHVNPIPLMLWQGIGYALGASAIWPSLSRVVAPEICSTAYGMMTSVQNLGMAVFPQVIGMLQTNSHLQKHSLKYTVPILIFVVCESIALSLALFLFALDKRTLGGKLNASAKQRQQMENAAKQKADDESRKIMATQSQARERKDMMRKAASEQAQLLERDVMTSRATYYARLNIRMQPNVRQPFTFRPAFT